MKVAFCEAATGQEEKSEQKNCAKLSRIIIHSLAYCQGQFYDFFSIAISVKSGKKRVWIAVCGGGHDG